MVENEPLGLLDCRTTAVSPGRRHKRQASQSSRHGRAEEVTYRKSDSFWKERGREKVK